MHCVTLEEFQISPVSLLQLLGDRFLIAHHKLTHSPKKSGEFLLPVSCKDV